MTWFAVIVKAIFVFDFSALLLPAAYTRGILHVSEKKLTPKPKFYKLKLNALIL